MIDDPAMLNDWYVVARASDLDEKGILPARLFDEEIVLWRSGDEVMAWQDYCLHRGARLSLGTVREGRLACPYHGWQYDTEGVCKFMPAHPGLEPPKKARVVSYKAKEAYGFIWVTPGEPTQDVPPFYEWDKPEYKKLITGPYEFHGGPFRSVENFIDIPHFPHVHPGINGDPDNPDVIEDYEVFKDENGIRTSPIPIYQPFGDHRGKAVMTHYTYYVFRPLTAYFHKDVGEGNIFCMMLTITPLAPDDCLVWLHVAINFGDEVTDQQIIERQDQVFAQDKWIVESQRPPEIPLDLKDELHVRGDKYSVAYRRFLAERGITWGVQPIRSAEAAE